MVWYMINPKQMKTAEEAAEALTEDLHSQGLGSRCDWGLIKIIVEQALTAFAEEQVKEALKSIDEYAKGQYTGYEIKLKEARNEALEEAAKALDALYHMKGSENDGMVFVPDAQATIRGLKSL